MTGPALYSNLLRRATVAALLLCCSSWALAQRVAFINPGRSDETFWLTASQAMQAAATSLQMQLEELYAERDPERALQLAREIAARPAAQRPDYVVLVNEKLTLVANAQTLGAAGIKTFAAFSALLPQERRSRAPREGLPLLLGSLEPDAHQAGYLTARTLIAQGRRMRPAGQPLQLLVIAGDRSTPTSIQRNEGMRSAIAEQRDVELMETVFADWRRDLAAEQAQQLLQRHPQSQLVWAGSDQMAFGAMQAAEQQGRKPGHDLLFSAINTSPEAMQAVIDGRLAALAGGHFMAGAWAMVMLYDYHHGHDFAAEGLEQSRPMFLLFGKAEARRYLARFGTAMPRLDFRPFSKRLNPQLRRYDFSLGALLR